MVYTESELYDKLTNDKGFAASFAVQNNFPAIQQRFLELGYDTVQTPKDAFDLFTLFSDGGAREILQYILNVPYKKDAPNETAGYETFFAKYNPQKTQGGTKGKIDPLQGALTFLTGGVGGFAAYLLGGGSPDSSGGKTPEQLAAEEAERKKKEEEEKAKRKKMWWIIGGIGGGLALLGTLLFIFLPKKKKSNG